LPELLQERRGEGLGGQEANLVKGGRKTEERVRFQGILLKNPFWREGGTHNASLVQGKEENRQALKVGQEAPGRRTWEEIIWGGGRRGQRREMDVQRFEEAKPKASTK